MPRGGACLCFLSSLHATWVASWHAHLRPAVNRPQEWMTPQPSRRPDVQPEFEKLEVPLPRKLPGALPFCTSCQSALSAIPNVTLPESLLMLPIGTKYAAIGYKVWQIVLTLLNLEQCSFPLCLAVLPWYTSWNLTGLPGFVQAIQRCLMKKRKRRRKRRRRTPTRTTLRRRSQTPHPQRSRQDRQERVAIGRTCASNSGTALTAGHGTCACLQLCSQCAIRS